MPPNEPWSECPAGELAELQRSLKEQESRLHGRRKLMITAGSVTLGIASAGIGIILSRNEPHIAILSCQETVELLPKYADRSLSSPAKRKAVEMHLNHCRKCREYYEATY
ncbi:hypothetical protein Pan97_43530 [Bremerella volcania]|uniref:Putative zinc-finger domain-containing protein n=1 Tax=Bremerella volcania TaxID=2527984 RepID=A0A518CDI0_9BACT|nr:zf-HC2 domain-containing protein [Bremerella volcania]QDU77286.1 hypothetical protein Pan97_43530 [Bremerella volcania]